MTFPRFDLYEALGVDPEAEPEVINAAFRAKARLLHPDVNPGNEVAAEAMKRVTQAHAILSDPPQRRQYDRQRRSSRGVREEGPPRSAPGSGQTSSSGPRPRRCTKCGGSLCGDCVPPGADTCDACFRRWLSRERRHVVLWPAVGLSGWAGLSWALWGPLEGPPAIWAALCLMLTAIGMAVSGQWLYRRGVLLVPVLHGPLVWIAVLDALLLSIVFPVALFVGAIDIAVLAVRGGMRLYELHQLAERRRAAPPCGGGAANAA